MTKIKICACGHSQYVHALDRKGGPCSAYTCKNIRNTPCKKFTKRI